MLCSFCPSSCWLTCYKCIEIGLVCETVNDHGTWWPYLELEGGTASHRNHPSHTKFGNRTIISFRFITCFGTVTIILGFCRLQNYRIIVVVMKF
ncbi:hypothetical protein C0J52_20514 [Blattella germanica]|nr:hypothetical protein C0J52_20514 [Blattella germanica]